MKNIWSPASKLLTVLVASAAAATAAHAQNIALTSAGGTAILGVVTTANDTTFGTSYVHGSGGNNNFSFAQPGGAAVINDGVVTDTADNFSGSGFVAAGAAGESFVGVTFAAPVTLGLGSTVGLYLNLFSDGGWFGTPGVGATNGALTAANLVDPHVQYTLNGTTWTTLTGVTDNYVAQYTGVAVAQNGANSLNGATVGGLGSHVLATFNLNTALTGVEGIRLTGTNGGTAGSGGFGNYGFLGVQEFQVNVPEPSTYALLALGGAAAVWLGLRRRVRLG